MSSFKKWLDSGLPWIWFNAGAVAISLVLVVGLLTMIAVRGLGHFWPSSVAVITLEDAEGKQTIAGEFADSESVSREQLRASGVTPKTDEHFHTRYLIKTGNRELTNRDFRWVLAEDIQSKTYPKDVVVLERWEWGNFYGFLTGIKENETEVSGDLQAELNTRLTRALAIEKEIHQLEKKELTKLNYEKEDLHLIEKNMQRTHDTNPKKLAEVTARLAELQKNSEALQARLNELYTQASRDSIQMKTISGNAVNIPLSKIASVYRPNEFSWFQKIGFYVNKVWEFLSEDPREANTEGGIFPAIFGTILMVMMMSIVVTPCGVIAAVYLREYAKQGAVTRMIRIAVNNLAGVPSIVYGVFGLGFFVYFLGSNIDKLFFPEKLPSPTFGTPGLLWASITLSLLTLPVVIVATEEGLARIPRSIREGSLALGATQAETIWRVVLPMASPAIMTGLILAIARAAGEVAPLMLVGVVKLAPALALDGNYPFLHLDRKFMHLGFHIYDVGFQSPNVEAARPLVYATAFLLVMVIILLNVTAISIRNNLREKYKSLEM